MAREETVTLVPDLGKFREAREILGRFREALDPAIVEANEALGALGFGNLELAINVPAPELVTGPAPDLAAIAGALGVDPETANVAKKTVVSPVAGDPGAEVQFGPGAVVVGADGAAELGPALPAVPVGVPDRVILGFDPATKASGWAALGLEAGAEFPIEWGTHNAIGMELTGRLAAIFEFVREKVRHYRPVVVVVESVFHGPNAKTTIALAGVGAAVRLAAHLEGAAVLDCAPAERLGALGLGGKASKAEVLEAVRRIYSIPVRGHNAADAIAIAAWGAGQLKEREIEARAGVRGGLL